MLLHTRITQLGHASLLQLRALMAKTEKPTTDTKKSRVSKEAAVQLFLDATIALLKEKPILDITLQDIANQAGLNHGYVFRYFGTRLDLFFAVTEELARLAEHAVTTEIERRLHVGEAVIPLNFSVAEVGRAYLRQRQAVIQYLVTAGVDPARFSETSRKTTEYFAQQFVTLGMNERMAITQATKLIKWVLLISKEKE